MLEASAFQALQVWAPYRGRNKPPVELVVRDLEQRCNKYNNKKELKLNKGEQEASNGFI